MIEIIVQTGRLGVGAKHTLSSAFITKSPGVYSRTGQIYGCVDEGRGIQIEAWMPADLDGNRRIVYSKTLFGKEVFNKQARNKLGALGAFEQLPVPESELDACVDAARAAIQAATQAATQA